MALLPLILVLAAPALGLFRSKVCYNDVGCFENHKPFSNAMHYLPKSPQDIHVTALFLTNKDPDHGHVLDPLNPSEAVLTSFNASNPTKVIVHGFLSDGGEPWLKDIAHAYLKKGAYNVFLVDWKEGAHVFYPNAVANTRVVGAVLSKFLQTLATRHGLQSNSVHVIGHSLGSHIAGYIGTDFQGLDRITGLDPAGPLFEDTDVVVRIDPADARLVECIHSDGAPVMDMGFGTLHAWCDVDYFPNGGGQQPGCNNPYKLGLLDFVKFDFGDIGDDISCSHHRAIDLFIESLTSTSCQFNAFPCSSFKDFQAGQCHSCGSSPCPILGHDTPRTGSFFLTTNGQSPFCKV